MAADNSRQYQPWIPAAPVSNLYPFAYNFVLVKSIEELTKILSVNFSVIAFDTETTSLNPDEADLVGFSFCYDGKNAFYVPVNHAPYTDEVVEQIDIEIYEANKDNPDYYFDDIKNSYFHVVSRTEHDDSLGEEALKIFYNSLDKATYILTFNQRYDVRIIERYDTVHNYTEDRFIHRYDLSKHIDKLIDVQAIIFMSDTNVPYPNLKGCEEKYLGWRGASFKDTLGDADNFYHLRPSECYTYAATDALGTFLLGEKMWHYYLEPSMGTRYRRSNNLNDPNKDMLNSGELDTKFLYPLMLMEDEFTTIDVPLMQEYSDWYAEEIKKTLDFIYEVAQDRSFNPLSAKQKTAVFNKLGIIIRDHDGNPIFNKRGEYKADKEHLQLAISKLPEGDQKRNFLEALIRIANLTKQKGTYADNFVNFCKPEINKNCDPSLNPECPAGMGKLRFGYKTMVVPSGRLAAGGDKKNSYYANSNIQNIPKPKTTMIYYVKYDELITKLPNFTGQFDNPRQECWYNFKTNEVYTGSEGQNKKDFEKTYMILDWIFKESIWRIEGLKEKKIEGFKQNLNIRSAFCSDDDKYWVSCDFSAQELRVPALLTREPGWCRVFENNGDLHEHMAKVIWGEENYDKQKRKRAKTCNFGILYGMTARNFAIDFNISMDEAQKIVDDYKGGAPKLFEWVHANEELAKRTGITHTMFGRPRRLGWYLSKDRDRGMQNFGIRSCTNTVIQGTGADILKISFLNIYNLFYNTPENRKVNRKYFKFINTVHDEINYNVSKTHVKSIIPKIISCMRLWYYDWDFPMQVGLEIGTRWGQTIAFDYDINPFIEYDPNKHIGLERYSKMSDQEASLKDIHGLKKYIPDINGNFVKNPNYLQVLEPSGDDLSEKDYEVKEAVEEKVDEVLENIENEEKLFDNLLYDYSGFENKIQRDHSMSNIGK